MQFYVLAVLANLVAGLTLASDMWLNRLPILASLKQVLETTVFKRTVGIASIGIGILKLMFYAAPGQIPVVGDLIPALAAIVAGSALSIDVLQLRPPAEDEETEEISEPRTNTLQELKMWASAYCLPIGLISVGAGILHFLFPRVPFL